MPKRDETIPVEVPKTDDVTEPVAIVSRPKIAFDNPFEETSDVATELVTTPPELEGLAVPTVETQLPSGAFTPQPSVTPSPTPSPTPSSTPSATPVGTPSGVSTPIPGAAAADAPVLALAKPRRGETGRFAGRDLRLPTESEIRAAVEGTPTEAVPVVVLDTPTDPGEDA